LGIDWEEKMFEKARIKLTLWYLLIIMAISFAFSGIIYKGVADELEVRLNTLEHRIMMKGEIPSGPPPEFQPYFIEGLEIAKNRVLLILIYTNTGILMFSAIAGYFLADRTLRPIEKALEEQKRFVADASHELKTPLTALQTSMEVTLRDKKLKLKDAKSVLSESLEDIGQLTNLTNYLLSLTKYQEDKNGLEFSEVNIKEVVGSAYKKLKALGSKSEVDIKIKVNKQLISGNKESLEKLMVILLDNALKYTPKGGKVTIDSKKDRGCVRIFVRDTGVGIAKKDQPYIFERFYRADQSRSKANVQGFGLGLAMAKRIVELHHGSIKVESVEGKGTTFIVKLPA